MNTKILSVFTRRLHCCRLLLSSDSLSVNDALPSNLVLFGISKERFKAQEPIVEDSPPDDSIPVIRECVSPIPIHKKPISVWVDKFTVEKPQDASAAHLHPLLFGVHPRMDILHQVVRWQERYREVDYAWSRTRADFGWGKRKPWPQKGTGRVRQGSRTAPSWKGGGICRGPRGPRSLFYQLPESIMVKGLVIALTIKLIQGDLIVVDSLDMPGEKASETFYDYIESRHLTENTMLFVHSEQNNPENLGRVLTNSKVWSLMPSQGLNVWSMLKHDKLVLPIEILDDLERKLIWRLNKYYWLGQPHNFYKDMPGAEGLKAERQHQTYNAVYENPRIYD